MKKENGDFKDYLYICEINFSAESCTSLGGASDALRIFPESESVSGPSGKTHQNWLDNLPKVKNPKYSLLGIARL